MSENGWNFANTYIKLPELFFKKQNPTPVSDPKVVIINNALAESLGLNIESLHQEDGTEILVGNKIPHGSLPISQAYAGHQFGHFTMLGDGRAVLLGEQITPKGQRFDIQLKGSGPTPFSRGGDGRAALGPMLREYIISEAMYGLGIPTTRSLAVAITGEPIYREAVQPGAVLSRVAASHIRVGTFQYAKKWGTTVEELQALTDYTIDRHFPELNDEDNSYLSFLRAVIDRQASLISKWQLVGFIHGVMNTDNMAISGETIDYGPCAFMDTYDPDTVFSSIDRNGRYAYKNQPPIGGWNLVRFAESLLPLIHEDEEKAVQLAQQEMDQYLVLCQKYWLSGMRAKIGLFNEESEDEKLIQELLEIMKNQKADYTNTFQGLTIEDMKDSGLSLNEFNVWKQKWEDRLNRQDENKTSSLNLMKNYNPAVIPRNHRVEEVLEAANEGVFQEMNKLLEVLANPYEYNLSQVEYAKLPPETDRPYRTFCGT
ncbi:YdiU family protein [Bacillaceae bacterium S4-13-58]